MEAAELLRGARIDLNLGDRRGLEKDIHL